MPLSKNQEKLKKWFSEQDEDFLRSLVSKNLNKKILALLNKSLKKYLGG